MSHIVFFLEEPSAKAMLDGFLPKILPDNWYYLCVVFEGKQDLETQIVKRLRGYRIPGAKFVILRDKDAGDCKIIKNRLVKKCKEAYQSNVLVRIACHEIESWYLADLSAVQQGLDLSHLLQYQNQRKFSSPDDYPFPVETLKEIVPSYQKIGGSRSIGPYLDPDNTRSHSFSVFVSGLRKLCASPKRK